MMRPGRNRLRLLLVGIYMRQIIPRTRASMLSGSLRKRWWEIDVVELGSLEGRRQSKGAARDVLGVGAALQCRQRLAVVRLW